MFAIIFSKNWGISRPLLFIRYLSFCICCIGCSSNKSNEDNAPNFSQQKLSSQSFEIDSIILENHSFSGRGFFRIVEDKLCFFDTSYFLLSFYDSSGVFIENKLGFGNNSNEIDQFISYVPTSEHTHTFFGLDYFFRRFDRKWNKQGKSYMLNWVDRASVAKAIDFENENMYDFNWMPMGSSDFRLSIDRTFKIYFPVNVTQSVSPSINKYNNFEQYYKNVHTVGVIDSKTGRLESVFGNFPKAYNSGKNLTAFAYSYIELKKDSVLVSYPIDPAIYVYNPEHQVEYSFGVPGRDMKTNYEIVNSSNELKRKKKEIDKKFGYYTNIYADNESDLVFRFYTKGGNHSSAMQIYKNRTLIQDIDVPEQFFVIGKIGDTFYARGIIDSKNNKLGIYTFKF